MSYIVGREWIGPSGHQWWVAYVHELTCLRVTNNQPIPLITDMFQPAQLTPSQQQHQQQVRQRQQLREQQQQQQQQQAAATQLAEVQQQAVAHFWELLGDFVALSAAPQSWLPQISPSHPFLHVTGDQVLCVHRIAVDQSAD